MLHVFYTYLSITVRVCLAVRVAPVAAVSTPGPWTADLSWARLIGVVLLFLLAGPQRAQSSGQQLALQSVEKWGKHDWIDINGVCELWKQLWSEEHCTLGVQAAGFFLLSALYREHSMSPLAFLHSSKTLIKKNPSWNCMWLLKKWYKKTKSFHPFKFHPSTSPERPLLHLVDHHSAAPGQQVPLGGHLTTQGIMLHLPHPIHLPTSVWIISRRGDHHICCIIS